MLNHAVGWRSFANARDRREVSATRSDDQVMCEIGAAQTLLTPAHVDELVERHRDGEGMVTLAKAYGVHRFTVAAHLGCTTAARPHRRPSAARRPPLLRGLTFDEIAAEFGTSQRTVGEPSRVSECRVVPLDLARGHPRSEMARRILLPDIAGCDGPVRVVTE